MWRYVIVVLCAAVAVGSAPANGEPQTITLEWQQSQFSHPVEFIISPTEELRFRAEPVYAGSRIERIPLPLSDDRTEFLGIAIDVDAERLYIDANRNLDLTDDPEPFPARSSEDSMMFFNDVHLVLDHDGLAIPYVLSLNISFGYFTQVLATIHSGWEGHAEIDGVDFRIAVMDNLNGRFGEGDGFEFAPVHAQRAVTPSSTIPAIVMANERPFALDLSLVEPTDADETPAIRATLQPSDTAMGVVNIQGQYISQIMFDGPTQKTATGAGPLHLPSGTYTVRRVLLEDGWVFDQERWESAWMFTVPPQGETTLAAGGPIRETITARRFRRSIHLSYENEGIDGFEYMNNNRAGPPGFVVMKGDKEVAAGTIEYG